MASSEATLPESCHATASVSLGRLFGVKNGGSSSVQQGHLTLMWGLATGCPHLGYPQRRGKETQNCAWDRSMWGLDLHRAGPVTVQLALEALSVPHSPPHTWGLGLNHF